MDSPTEATIGCTSRRVRANDRKENIGTPFSACRAFVVRPQDAREDAHFEVVPRGAPGELIIEGPLVGLGYHNNPKATRKNFVQWPHPGCRAYRTGDLGGFYCPITFRLRSSSRNEVRMMPDDTLEIIGRIDSQIKLRGVRIETEGISNVLTEAAKRELQRSIVSMTVVGGHDTVGGGSELLLSFIAPGGDMQPPVSSRKSGRRPTIIHPSVSDGFFSAEMMRTVKEAANKELPSYMRPAYILPVSFIPLNSNGKADGKVLKELFRASQFQDIIRTQRWNGKESERRHDSESISMTIKREPTPSEILVIKLVSRLTRSANLSFRSNLFELGLDSIKFSVLARLMRQELLPDSTGRRPIGVSALMSRPTIQDVSLLVEDHRNRLANSSKGIRSPSDRTYTAVFDDTWRAEASKVFDPSEIETVLPPFPVQEGVIFQSIQEPGHYVEHFLYQCETGIDLEKLRNAWERIVARQAILRYDHILLVLCRPL
jgi:ferricrocin synthase